MYSYGITGTSIDEFQDVDLSSLADGYVLQWDETSGTFVAVSAASLGIASDLASLDDVVLTSPTEFQTLEYDGTNWVNKHSSVVTYVRNVDTVDLDTGTAVYLFGATGDHATVKRADNDSDTTSAKTIGLVAASILQNENGTVVTRGYVDGIDLSVGYTAGDILWLGEDGGFTKTKPSSPEHVVFLGVVVRANSNGIVYVAVQNGFELDELHNVAINAGTLADNNVLQYNSSTQLWENVTPATLAGDITLDNLSNVTVPSPSPGQVLVWNGAAWVNTSVSITLDQLSTVTAPSPSDGQVLTYDTSTSQWVAETPITGSELSSEVMKYSGAGTAETFDRLTGLVSARTLTSGVMYLTSLVPNNSVTVDEINVFVGNGGSGLTLVRLGLYTFDGTTYTLVARTADIKASATTNTAFMGGSFDTTGGYPATYDLVKGTQYYLGVIQTGTTPATVLGPSTPSSVSGYAAFVNAGSPKLCRSIAGQTDLMTSVAESSMSNSVIMSWGKFS